MTSLTRNALLPWLIAFNMSVVPVAALAADPADSPALEWLEGDGAHELVLATEGVVFVDLFAHY